MEHTTETPQVKAMDSKAIPEDELGRVYIGETGVTVLDVICALCAVLDGNHVYGIHAITGLSLEQCKEIIETSDSVQPIWMRRAPLNP